MAGGPNAAYIPCMQCAGKAKRISEGIEDDRYQCSECEKQFSIDWEADEGPPKQACWPPSKKWLTDFQIMREKRDHLKK